MEHTVFFSDRTRGKRQPPVFFLHLISETTEFPSASTEVNTCLLIVGQKRMSIFDTVADGKTIIPLPSKFVDTSSRSLINCFTLARRRVSRCSLSRYVRCFSLGKIPALLCPSRYIHVRRARAINNSEHTRSPKLDEYFVLFFFVHFA